jgi:hypothetical protein
MHRPEWSPDNFKLPTLREAASEKLWDAQHSEYEP